jgi:hypothetical protein
MLVGIISGTYSTIFIASSIAIMLGQRRRRAGAAAAPAVVAPPPSGRRSGKPKKARAS